MQKDQPHSTLNDKELPRYANVHNKLRKNDPFEKEYLDYEKLIRSVLTTESALVKVRHCEIPPTGAENHLGLQKVMEQ